MQARALLASCTLLASSMLVAQESLPTAGDELLHNARVWEARDRADLARLALEKHAAARPDSPEALLELGELNLRMSDMRAAGQVLERLNARFPGSSQARTFAVEHRFATRDRLQLASVARLIQTGREEEARQQLDELFPGGAPGGMLSTEYYKLLAGTPSGWKPAQEGLKELAAAHPDNPRYALAHARLLLYNEATAVDAVVLLSVLARREDVRVADVDGLLASSLPKVGERVPPWVFREYLARNPDDTAVRKALHIRELASEQRELLANRGLERIDPDSQRRNLRQLNDALAALPKSNSLADEGRTLGQLVTGQLPESTPAGNAALAATWMIRSGQAQDALRLELAAVLLHSAVAIRNQEYEATIPLASRLESLSESALGGELLAAASKMDPGSEWLFETSVRWLANHGHAEQALLLLSSRKGASGANARARNDLRALALARRSQARVEAGRLDAAMGDLKQAIAIAPRDPWNRYRLANLYAQQGHAELGRAVFDEGIRHAATDREMRYAQGLYLASIDDYVGAVAAIESIATSDRNEGIVQLDARARIEVALASARRLRSLGDAQGARAALLEVEPFAQLGADRMSQLAFAWIELGDASRAVDLAAPYADWRAGDDRAPSTQELLVCAQVLDGAGESEQMNAVLDRVWARPLTAQQRATAAHLQGTLGLRRARALQRAGDFESAAQLLDGLLQRTPGDRRLRIARAEVDLAEGHPGAASDRLAALTDEQPEDLEARLTLVRALDASGETVLARMQLEAAQSLARADDADSQLRIARSQLAIGDAAAAERTMQTVLASLPVRADALLVAGRAAHERRKYAAARDYYLQAQAANDESIAAEARLAQEAIDIRLQSWVEGAFEARHKPGDPGISRFDLMAIPVAWVHTMDDGRRLTLRMDAIDIDAGDLSSSFDVAALLGTIQAAGPEAHREYANDAQSGLSFGVGYSTDTLNADVGSTPRDFLLPQIVGGIEWTPESDSMDIGLGLSRRMVTSSVLSYGGLRDPITGTKWGGVVATGAHARLGIYRERYGVSGALAAANLTGTHVPDNRFYKARVSADWKFLAREQARAFIGATINYWRYDRNLQNYTFGSGGYYSPQSYVSVAVPVEGQGRSGPWSYRLRASVAYTFSKVDAAPFYPSDPDLQHQAGASSLPAGFDEPNFPSSRGSGISLSAYAAVERQISRAVVVGAKLDIDRADYYEPTTYMLYLRRVFGSPGTPLATPPRPLTLLTDY